MATGGRANITCCRPMARARGSAGASVAPGTGSGSAAAPSASSQKRLRSCSLSSPSGPVSVVTPSRAPRSGEAWLPPANRHSRKRLRRGPAVDSRPVFDTHAVARDQRRDAHDLEGRVRGIERRNDAAAGACLAGVDAASASRQRAGERDSCGKPRHSIHGVERNPALGRPIKSAARRRAASPAGSARRPPRRAPPGRPCRPAS